MDSPTYDYDSEDEFETGFDEEQDQEEHVQEKENKQMVKESEEEEEEEEVSITPEELTEVKQGLICAVCLNSLNQPVKLPCGHLFCLSCITGCEFNEKANAITDEVSLLNYYIFIS